MSDIQFIRIEKGRHYSPCIEINSQNISI